SSDHLGVSVAYAEQYHLVEIVPTTWLAAAVAIIPIRAQTGPGLRRNLWVVHSFDRVS
ncbi:uncharacterized protein BXZ73DRAFT_7686, partial [Epithele typhae]